MIFDVEVFAILKDYLPENFTLETEKVLSIDELKDIIEEKNPGVKEVLRSCRFAFNHEMIGNDTSLTSSGTISVLPPSSGG